MSNLSNLLAERAVLSGIYNHGNECYFDICDILNDDSFTDIFNKCLYKCFKKILQEENQNNIDYTTLLITANSLGFSQYISNTTNEKLLKSILDTNVSINNSRTFAGQIRKLQIARMAEKQLDLCHDAISKITGEESINSIISLIESPILDFASLLNDKDGPERIGDGIENYIQYLADNPVQQVGIPTGFNEYDESIGGGLRRKSINVIAARFKKGKSLIGDAAAVNIAKLGIPVLNLDTEMSKEDHWNRMLASISGVPIKIIETGQFAKNSDYKNKVLSAIKMLKDIPYDYQSIAGQPFEDTLSSIRRWLIKKVGLRSDGSANDCVIIFDYIKLMSSEGISKNMQEYQVLGFQMTGMHNFAVRYSIPFLAFAQMNRDGIDGEDTHVISGSDRIGWLCSSLAIFKDKTPEEMAEGLKNGYKYNKKLITLACRHGPGLEPGDYINMTMTGNIGRVVEGKRHFELEQQLKQQSFSSNESTNTVF